MNLLDHPDMKIIIKGLPLLVKQGVFNPDPKGTNSPSIILNNIPDLKGKEVLDMGCGTGLIGIYCALKGAKRVIASDIDNKALENTQENIKLNKIMNLEVVKSDLFKKINVKFDYIFANLPINDKSWNLGISTIDLLKKFLFQAQKHLKKNGKFYFVWIAEDGVEEVRAVLKENKFKFKEITEEKLNKIWSLFEVEK